MKLKRELIMMIIYSVMNHQKKSLIIRNHIPHKRKMIIFIVAHQKMLMTSNINILLWLMTLKDLAENIDHSSLVFQF